MQETWLPALVKAAVIQINYMKNDIEKPGPFELICLVAFIVFLSLSIYLFSNSHTLFGLIIGALSVWALVIYLGKIFIGSAYLEGHIVRLLLKNGGKMPIPQIQKYYERYGSLNSVLVRMQNRSVIETKNGIIELIEDNLNKGFKNHLMMWGTRRVKL